MNQRKTWSKAELILAFNLYLKIPFGKFHHRNKDIIELASLIGRTPSAIAMRLSNFASVDPYHQQRGIKGLTGGILQVQPIWDEFHDNKEELIFESELILAELQHTSVEKKYKNILNGTEGLVGETKIREIKTRVNQRVFRDITIANFNGRCTITGFNNTDFLIASHILPWAKNVENRLNPQNGLLLNSLHDKAFENGYLGINKNYQIQICSEFRKSEDSFVKQYFGSFHNKEINQPSRFLPNINFLEQHLEETFKG